MAHSGASPSPSVRTRDLEGSLRRLRSCVLAALFLLTAVASAPAAGADDSPAPAWDVTLGGESVFRIQTAFKTIPPAERARLVSERLESLARNPAFEPESLRVEETEFSTDLMAGDVVAVAVLDADTAGTGLDRHTLATQRLREVRAAVARYRDQRSTRHLSLAIGASVLAVVALLLVLMLLARLRKRVSATLNRWIEERREKIKAKTYSMLEPDRLLEHWPP